jgi:hypothetical protein
VGESYIVRVTQSAVQLRHLSGCDAVVCFGVQILTVLLSHVERQRFVEILCENFPPTEEVSFMLTVRGTVTIIVKEV